LQVFGEKAGQIYPKIGQKKLKKVQGLCKKG
jgi:hypothetical protein